MKKRLFYLDFVRTIATISILLTHYNARFLEYYMHPAMPDRAIITLFPFNIYIGAFGVALFFIISGAALMYTYQSQCSLKDFYSKRFLSIYPMFWIGYILVFLYYFYASKHLPYLSVPKPYFLVTLLGMDGYLSGILPSYYLIGEWFLGCIILIYLMFPLLRKLALSHPYLLCIGALLLYLPFTFWIQVPNFLSSKLLMVRLPEIIFGMIFVLKIKRVRFWMVIPSVLILIVNTIFKPTFPESFQTTYIGISCFLILTYVSAWFDRPFFRSVCSIISKYSYAIFLTHHVIIDELANRFPMTELVRSERYMLFFLCCFITAIASWILYHLNRKLLIAIRKIRSGGEKIA
ncbi:acyltransferase family protein [Fusibacillus kribbianus]|uniref:Acyltransferase n=1 Tax=Fusibacillus kribbianus TaxID=3044208 RepID=A0AAP4EYA6_9FIRM|nr:acyltransferase family protein [Ruminococcus sp. YH-rum2234]MDI9241631.1 acyltransferase [Ruminococcus sp. YH-rum2234]